MITAEKVFNESRIIVVYDEEGFMYSFKTFVAEEMGHRRQLGACKALGFFVFFSLVVFSRMSLPDSQMPYVFHFRSLGAMATIISY